MLQIRIEVKFKSDRLGSHSCWFTKTEFRKFREKT